MALPTSDDLKTMDYSFDGQPFVSVPLSNIDTTTMDYAFDGQPFVTNPSGNTGTTYPVSGTVAIISTSSLPAKKLASVSATCTSTSGTNLAAKLIARISSTCAVTTTPILNAASKVFVSGVCDTISAATCAVKKLLTTGISGTAAVVSSASMSVIKIQQVSGTVSPDTISTGYNLILVDGAIAVQISGNYYKTI
jgi:hypothetical protein